MFDDQTGFSNTFDIAGWEELGHYATTAGGLTYLPYRAGAPNSRKIKVTDIARDFQVATGIVGRKGKVVVAVKDTSVYKQGGTLVSTPPKDADGVDTAPSGGTSGGTSGTTVPVVPTGKGPKYDHWVVFEDLQLSGKVVTISIGTWAAHYTARSMPRCCSTSRSSSPPPSPDALCPRVASAAPRRLRLSRWTRPGVPQEGDDQRPDDRPMMPPVAA